MTETGKIDPQLGWIYEGTKSLVNREDYLLGKKVDKNFELYSDAVIKEKESGIEAVEKPRQHTNDASSSKISNLEVDIVRTEDPLVAIKMKQERVWQEKMDNPLVKLKMQKLMKKVVDKMEKKRLKKLKKLEKKKRKRRHSSGSSRDASRRSDERHKRHRSDSSECTGIPSTSSELSKKEKEKYKGKHLQRDSHIPEHLRPKYNSSSGSDGESEKATGKSATKKYGLVKTGKQEVRGKEEVDNPYKDLPKRRQMEPFKRPERRKLTEEEMEAKRREMMENADWRDKVRVHNIKKNQQRDEEEDRKNEGKAANFIRPMLNSAASTMTVERQLNSHRRGLQRTTGFTEEKFVKR